jgi:hypothetical protein
MARRDALVFKQHVFPITPALKAVLDAQRVLTTRLEKRYIFCQTIGKKRGGRPISYMGYVHAFNDARDAAKLRTDLIRTIAGALRSTDSNDWA